MSNAGSCASSNSAGKGSQMSELGQFSDNLQVTPEWEVSGAPYNSLILQHWCERGDSNPHGCPLDPKSSASASSATLAGQSS